MEELYNNFPDICVSKKDLKANYFPSSRIVENVCCKIGSKIA